MMKFTVPPVLMITSCGVRWWLLCASGPTGSETDRAAGRSSTIRTSSSRDASGPDHVVVVAVAVIVRLIVAALNLYIGGVARGGHGCAAPPIQLRLFRGILVASWCPPYRASRLEE